MISRDRVLERLNWCYEHKWLASCEFDRLTEVLDRKFVFAECVEAADSIHAHVKVRDADALPEEMFLSEGASIHYRKPGFVKYQFQDGINLMFSSIPISQDDLRNGTAAPEKMFLDHIGIDLRQVLPETQQLFDALPAAARQRGWGHVPQGDAEHSVYCCHVEVGRKHWIYPEDRYTRNKAPAMPLEFAFGELRINDISSGCDLRPSDPRFHEQTACCGKA